jgi:ferritin
MLSEKMTIKLNKQINLEFYSSNLYLQMSAWAATNGLPGSALFLKMHAKEEQLHMDKLFNYVLETGDLPILGGIDAPSTEYKSLEDIFSQTLEHEKNVTKGINDLVDFALNEKDFSTFNFLQWYVAEQHEEENLFNSIIEKFKVIGTDGRGLYLIDKEIGKLVRALN